MGRVSRMEGKRGKLEGGLWMDFGGGREGGVVEGKEGGEKRKERKGKREERNKTEGEGRMRENIRIGERDKTGVGKEKVHGKMKQARKRKSRLGNAWLCVRYGIGGETGNRYIGR